MKSSWNLKKSEKCVLNSKWDIATYLAECLKLKDKQYQIQAIIRQWWQFVKDVFQKVRKA